MSSPSRSGVNGNVTSADSCRQYCAPVLLCQLATTGTVIGMHVRVDHMRDAHALAGRERHVGVDVVDAGVDDGASAKRAAAKQIRGAAEVEVIVGPQESSFARPDCSARSRRSAADRPRATREILRAAAARVVRCARSISTARSAYTQYGPAAVGHVFLAFGELLQSSLEVVDRHRNRPGDVPGDVLARRTRVENRRPASTGRVSAVRSSTRLRRRHGRQSAPGPVVRAPRAALRRRSEDPRQLEDLRSARR